MIPGSHPIYPTRSFIRFQAKNQIIADLAGEEITSFVQRPGASQEEGTVTPNPDWLNHSSGDAPDCPPQSSASNTAAMLLPFDEALFSELAKTVFHPDRHPELYQPCDSQADAMAIENQVIAELVETYERIARNQTDERVQRLNALL